MSIVSFATKIKNDMEEIEKESDKYIDPSKYYIIRLTLPENCGFEKTKTLGKSFLTRNDFHLPLSIYIFERDVYLIFSCVDVDQKHYLEGSHHDILSEYTSYASVYLEASGVRCNIIEFFSQTQIVSYFTWKTYINSKNYILKTLKKDMDKTLTELIEDLKNIGIEWNDIPSDIRYGTFYKLKKQNDRYVVSTLSEYVDASNYQKYISYIFGKSS